MQEIVIEQPGNLICMNLHGLNPKKLMSARCSFDASQINNGLRPVDIMGTPYGRLILDGHHQAVVANEHSVSILGFLWETEEEIENGLIRLNFSRGVEYHLTAAICGLGTIEQLTKLAVMV